MDEPRVSIVVVNWNRHEDVARIVRHLAKLRGSGPSFEVIVVDNGSTDGSIEGLASLADIRLVCAGENLGPARARNLGIEAAVGRYILFLDSDALLARNGLARLVERMDADPQIGIAGCRVVNGYTRKLDQWIYAEPAETYALVEFETYSFSAAGAIARAEALRKAGPFWDDLFIYNEEVDLSIRLHRAGYKILYYPHAPVYHFPSSRGREGSKTYWYYQIRNWIWIFYRYYPSMERWRKVVLYSMLYLVKGVLNRQLRACWSGIVAGLKQTDLIGQYDQKLTREELVRLAALNRRKSLHVGR